MVEAELWTPRRLRERRAHPPRRRRPRRGELIQIDGCEHRWFEGRAPPCVLLVFVDDATGELMELRFAPAESTFSDFASVRRYLERHGRPVAFYSDKASIFRVNRPQHQGPGLTQFGRAMQELNIDVLCANTAPAKGRVERAHQTLQDRPREGASAPGRVDHGRRQHPAGRLPGNVHGIPEEPPQLSGRRASQSPHFQRLGRRGSIARAPRVGQCRGVRGGTVHVVAAMVATAVHLGGCPSGTLVKNNGTWSRTQ
jgi:hypothetical protein